MKIARTILHKDGSRKVQIFQRPDGTFGFQELKLLDEPESCWIPIGKYSIAIIDTLDHAIEEARGRVSWVADCT